MLHRNINQPQEQCQTVGKIAAVHIIVELPMIDIGKIYYLKKKRNNKESWKKEIDSKEIITNEGDKRNEYTRGKQRDQDRDRDQDQEREIEFVAES